MPIAIPVFPVPVLPVRTMLLARLRKSSPASVLICPLLRLGCSSKGKVSSVQSHGQPRLLEPIRKAALALRGSFRTQQTKDELRRRRGLTLGALEFGIELCCHAVKTQTRKQRLQFVTHPRLSRSRD
jgi:hypothetical protein